MITGANRGIGLALTKQYIAEGNEVTALVRQSSQSLSESGARVIEGVDVKSLVSLQKAKELLGVCFFDLLINNAGIFLSESIDALDEAAFSRIEDQFLVNALGPLKVLSVFSDTLRKGSKCALITSRMGSIADNSSGSRYGYRMSKAALNMAGVSLAHDLKNREISVGIFHPGWVQTEMTGQSGNITASESASLLRKGFDKLSMATTGSFYHANGEELPW